MWTFLTWLCNYTTLPCDGCGERYIVEPFPKRHLCPKCEREARLGVKRDSKLARRAEHIADADLTNILANIGALGECAGGMTKAAQKKLETASDKVHDAIFALLAAAELMQEKPE